MYVKEQAWIELLIMPRVRFQNVHVVYTERLIILKSVTNSTMKIFDIDNSFCLIVPLIYSTITYVICLRMVIDAHKIRFF
jgi:hypothetical protein